MPAGAALIWVPPVAAIGSGLTLHKVGEQEGRLGEGAGGGDGSRARSVGTKDPPKLTSWG